jgi:hypothetical protein
MPRMSKRMRRKTRRSNCKSRKFRKLLKGGSGNENENLKQRLNSLKNKEFKERLNSLRYLTPKEAELKLKINVKAKEADTLDKKGEKDKAHTKYAELVLFMLNEITTHNMNIKEFDKDFNDYLLIGKKLETEIEHKSQEKQNAVP